MNKSIPTAKTIMIIRHGEKAKSFPGTIGIQYDGNPSSHSLIVRGWERAGALATLFDPSNGPLQYDSIEVPAMLYASTPGPNSSSNRPIETITPLTDKLGDQANHDFTYYKGEESKVADAAMAQTGPVLVAWQHESIHDIASSLPISAETKLPSQWPGDRYDIIWVFTLDTTTNTYLFKQLPQLLLEGDQP